MMIANVPNNAGHQMNSRLYLRELNLIRLLFLFCGYDLCQGRKPQSRWVKIIRCLWKIVIYFTFTVVAVKEVVSCTLMLTTQMDITFDERLFRVCISLLQITLTVCYVDMALKNDKWQILFETLTAFVEAIHSSSVKVNVKMTIHHWSVGVVVITVLYTLATFIGIITCYEQSNYFYRDIPLKTALPTIMAYIAKICLLTPFTFVPFVMLLETIPIFLYYILCKLFEINPGENSAVVDKSKEHGWLSASWSKNRQFLGDFLEWHRQMCDLVRMVESVLSARMLWYTGVKAVFVIISVQYTSSVRQDQDLVYISFIFSNVFNVALIVAQTILASRVNEQVTNTISGLSIFQDAVDFNAEVKSYHLYLTRFSVSTTALTFGGVTPITKSFLFTIGGTIISYYLILREIRNGQESQARLHCSNTTIIYAE